MGKKLNNQIYVLKVLISNFSIEDCICSFEKFSPLELEVTRSPLFSRLYLITEPIPFVPPKINDLNFFN